MKKIYLLFGIVMSLLLIGVVKAEGPYFLDFETEQQDDVSAKLNVGYKDGYLTADYDTENEDIVLTRLDKDGKVIKTKKLTSKRPVFLETKGNNIYLVYIDLQQDNNYIALLNENLGVEETQSINGPIYYNSPRIDFEGVEPLKVTEDEVLLLLQVGDANSGVYASFPRDLSEMDIAPASSSKLVRLFPELKNFDRFINTHSNTKGLTLRLNNTNNYLGVAYKSECTSPMNAAQGVGDQQGDAPTCRILNVELIDKDGKTLWKKILPAGYKKVEEIRFINEYVAFVASTEEKTSIIIYDFKGNLIQTIDSNNLFMQVIGTDKGFIVVQSSCGNIALAATAFSPNNTERSAAEDIVKYNTPECCFANAIIRGNSKGTQKASNDECVENHQVYYLYRKVEPKVTQGKGKIQVVKQQKPGEPVEFIITPDEGYVLGKVKVTDANGKTVVFTSNRFTMPTADVTIEVEFLVANANTADIAIISISLIAIIAGAIAFTHIKKIKEAK